MASAVLSVVSTMPDADDQTLHLESADTASLFVRHATTIADAKVRNQALKTGRRSCLPNAVAILDDLSSYPASQEERPVAPRNLLPAHTNLLLA